ncbi:hypothetical protein CF326_g9889, partial [Tilletia indica]
TGLPGVTDILSGTGLPGVTDIIPTTGLPGVTDILPTSGLPGLTSLLPTATLPGVTDVIPFGALPTSSSLLSVDIELSSTISATVTIGDIAVPLTVPVSASITGSVTLSGALTGSSATATDDSAAIRGSFHVRTQDATHSIVAKRQEAIITAVLVPSLSSSSYVSATRSLGSRHHGIQWTWRLRNASNCHGLRFCSHRHSAYLWPALPQPSWRRSLHLGSPGVIDILPGTGLPGVTDIIPTGFPSVTLPGVVLPTSDLSDSSLQ